MISIYFIKYLVPSSVAPCVTTNLVTSSCGSRIGVLISKILIYVHLTMKESMVQTKTKQQKVKPILPSCWVLLFLYLMYKIVQNIFFLQIALILSKRVCTFKKQPQLQRTACGWLIPTEQQAVHIFSKLINLVNLLKQFVKFSNPLISDLICIREEYYTHHSSGYPSPDESFLKRV